MKSHDYNSLAHEAYEMAKDHGFHDEKMTDEARLMLVVTELAEAVNADRRARHADPDAYGRHVLSGDRDKPTAFKDCIKDTVEDELADTAIRLLDYAGAKHYAFPDGWLAGPKAFGFHDAGDFPCNAFRMVGHVLRIETMGDRGLRLALRFLIEWAAAMKISLYWYIHEKMQYNATRPRLHGKRY